MPPDPHFCKVLAAVSSKFADWWGRGDSAAIGDVVSAWTTEGHSVAIPGLGYIRFGIRSTSVPTVNEMSTKLISFLFWCK